jgi:uncharacterized protein YcbK (DUF882 family)
MLRMTLFGAVFLLANTGGAGRARAEGETAAIPAASSSTAEHAAPAEGAQPERTPDQDGAAGQTAGDDEAGGDEAAAPSRTRKHRRRARTRRHGLVSGRVVPDDKLRQEPLGHPSGELRLVSVNSGEAAEVNIYNPDGSYNIDALDELNHVMRCRRTDDQKPMDLQLLMLLSHVYDHFGKKPLEMVSGYRNQRKKTSNHYKGTASDIRIAGVSPKKIEAFAETLDRGGMGIGLYPRSAFVHIDVRSPPSYRWIDYSPPNPDAAEKRPPRGWKRKKLQS